MPILFGERVLLLRVAGDSLDFDLRGNRLDISPVVEAESVSRGEELENIPLVHRGSLAFVIHPRALAAGKGDPEKAARHVEKNWNDKEFSKQLLEADFDAGGVLVPDEYVAEIIDLLSAQSTVRAMGASTMPMNSGSMTVPKLTKGATASYVGEIFQLS